MAGATEKPKRKKRTKKVQFESSQPSNQAAITSEYPHIVDPLDPVILGTNSLFCIREMAERKVLIDTDSNQDQTLVQEQHDFLLANHKNREELTVGDKNWIIGASAKRAMYYILRNWFSSDEVWNAIAIENTAAPIENGFRLLNSKVIKRLCEMQLEEFLGHINTIGIQKRPLKEGETKRTY